MSLEAGTRLGIYEIIALIGAGGMGRFLMGVQSEPETQEFRVVLNWFDELKRLVPVD